MHAHQSSRLATRIARRSQTATPIWFCSRRCYAIAAGAQRAAKDDARREGASGLEVPSAARYNDIGVQQLSSHVHAQLFDKDATAATAPPPDLVALSRTHLTRHDLLGKNQDMAPPVGFDLPPLQGATMDEHFYRLGMDAAEPYLSDAKRYARANCPPRPRRWERRSGWTKYHADGTAEPVDAPDEAVLTFDTEVMWKETKYACMACAVSDTAWYAWISPHLLGESPSDRHLIPLGDPARPRVVVGHNVGYDRARVAEEYALAQSKTAFVDTMSLHVAVNGMCSRQRPKWMKHRKDRELRDKIARSDESADLAVLLESGALTDEEEDLWIGRSSVNSLRDVAQFHCGVTIDKARREYFGELDRAGIVGKLDELLDYCAADVDITHKVYRKVFPLFLEMCPHPVSFAALRHLSSVILPVDRSWDAYLTNAEATYHQLSDAVEQRLASLAEESLAIKGAPHKYEGDPWLSQLDWSGQEVRMVKGKRKGDPPRPAARQKMPGMPQWYKNLFPTKDGPINLTVRTRVAPLLLRLCWDGCPLVWSDTHGWTFAVPIARAEKYRTGAATECDMMEEENPALKGDARHAYFKVPHKDGPTARCASPLAKGYLQYFEAGTLSSQYPYAKEALEMNASCSYWISARDRIRSQMVVYTEGERGFILPQIIPMGTITRRAVENTWLTASNAKRNRVGSELKAMVRAPPGHVFVGADVDSQELWIASLIGDAQFGLHGGSAVGFMTLEGSKAAGTDLHSRTAGLLGTARDDAKVFNYGRIYGAGLRFAATLLRRFNPTLSEADAQAAAQRLYAATKGQRTLRRALHERAFWRGGAESLVFNALEDFAEQERPRTPVLGAAITEALTRRFISRGAFMTSRINWAIQSSGVDYLHLLIVAMDHLVRRHALRARLALTVHDEIRYLVHADDALRAATALQVANLWTRAMFAQQLGLHDLPQACAFFSAVDVDAVLRKEVDMDCVTPSHPDPIPPGERLDIRQLLARGDAARLDPRDVPREGEAPRPERFEYAPRQPVIRALWDSRDEGARRAFLRAQMADDRELKELIKDVKGPAPKSSSSSSDPSHATPRRRRTITPTSTTPRAPRVPKAPKAKVPAKKAAGLNDHSNAARLLEINEPERWNASAFFRDWEQVRSSPAWAVGGGAVSGDGGGAWTGKGRSWGGV